MHLTRSPLAKSPLPLRWRQWWLLCALLAATPAIYLGNQALLQIRLEIDTRLIVNERLWESDPSYRGSPQNWTRFAAWLLDSEQLLERLRQLKPAQAEQIEEEYRRDAMLAYTGVIARYLALWGVPLALAYAALAFVERRRARHQR